MTAQEIIEKLKELNITTGERFVGNMEGYSFIDDFEPLDESAMDAIFGNIKEVHSQGDTEGGGEYSEKVYYFHDHDVYLAVTGYYYSYDGTHWNKEILQVFPKKKEIIEYATKA